MSNTKKIKSKKKARKQRVRAFRNSVILKDFAQIGMHLRVRGSE